MNDDVQHRLQVLEAELEALRAAVNGAAAPAEPVTSRRNLLRTAAIGTLGAVGGVAALTARPAAAATGANLVLGQANTAEAVTSLANDGPFPNLVGPAPVALELRSPGGHLRFVGAPGDTLLGDYEDGTLAYNGTQGLFLDTNGDLARVASAGFGPLLVLPQPIRLYDSRTPHIGGTLHNGPLASGTSRNLSIEIDNDDKVIEPIAPFVRAAMLNLTVVNTVGSGFLSVGNPGPTGTRTTSNVNWSGPGQILANLAFTTLFESSFTIFAGGSGSTDVVVDLMGLVG